MEFYWLWAATSPWWSGSCATVIMGGGLFWDDKPKILEHLAACEILWTWGWKKTTFLTGAEPEVTESYPLHLLDIPLSHCYDSGSGFLKCWGGAAGWGGAGELPKRIAPGERHQAGVEKVKRTSLAWVSIPMVKGFGRCPKEHANGYKRLKWGSLRERERKGGWGGGGLPLTPRGSSESKGANWGGSGTRSGLLP